MDDLGMRAEVLVPGDLRLDLLLVAVKGKLERRVLAKSARGAGNHRRWAGVPAHGVDGNSWAPGH